MATQTGDDIVKGDDLLAPGWQWLTAGAVDIVDAKHLHARIKRGDRLRVKLGLDPTRPDIHLGHAVVLRTLHRFQEAGHRAVIIIGDTTAQIGDPSGQNITRPQLTRNAVEEAARTYLEQIWKLLDREATEVRWQSEWFGQMRLEDVVGLMSKYTAARMLAREDFAGRLAGNRPIALHELLYPLLQAYDSVAVEADVELGGTDQKFNLLAGRDIQEASGQAPQDILTLPLLEGLDGKQKMSKSLDNYIGISEPPDVMYGKVMSVKDELIIRYFKLATDLSPEEVAREEKALSEDVNPRDVKRHLASAIVTRFHGAGAAAEAAEEFQLRFARRETPTHIEPFEATEDEQSLAALFVLADLAESKSEARRLAAQRGLYVNGKPVSDVDKRVKPQEGWILQRGSRQFRRLTVYRR